MVSQHAQPHTSEKYESVDGPYQIAHGPLSGHIGGAQYMSDHIAASVDEHFAHKYEHQCTEVYKQQVKRS